jgi:hypothetical protein
MSSPTSDQSDRSALLAEWLNVAGHDDLTGLDLLDALASTGLRLTWDRHGVVAAAYMETIEAINLDGSNDGPG